MPDPPSALTRSDHEDQRSEKRPTWKDAYARAGVAFDDWPFWPDRVIRAVQIWRGSPLRSYEKGDPPGDWKRRYFS